MPFGARPPWRRVVGAVLAVVTSVTTLTVVHKCVMVDTVKVETTEPVRKIVRATHGTVVASGELVLPRRDTVVVHDTVRTERVVTRVVERAAVAESVARVPDGAGSAWTRTASFHDSTFAGIIDGTITAPPDPAPLGVRYHLTRPVFAPTVAFLETPAGRTAVVSWRGERVRLEHVVFPPVRRPRVVRAIEVGYRPWERVATVTGEVGVRVAGSVSLMVSLTQRMGAVTVPPLVVAMRRGWD